MAKQDKTRPRVFSRDRRAEAVKHGCSCRQPIAGEEIHSDLRLDAGATKMLESLAWLVEPLRELASEDCPDDLTETLFFEAQQPYQSNPAYIVAWAKRTQAMLREVLRTGYEQTGWPVCYRAVGGSVRIMDGTKRLAFALTRGGPVRAIIQGERAKPDHS